MNPKEQRTFLTDFFREETEENPSNKKLKALLELHYDNHKPVLDVNNESERIEVLSLFKAIPYDDVMTFLSDVVTNGSFLAMVLESPLMTNARNAVADKREILSRGIPGAKAVFGTCPRCKYTELMMTILQTSSGDESMRITYSCQNCPFSWKG